MPDSDVPIQFGDMPATPAPLQLPPEPNGNGGGGTNEQFWIPTPGWVVRRPAQQDPNKREGDHIESPWLGAFGIYASGDGHSGLQFHAVLVHMPDMTQGLLGYTGLQWMPAKFEPPGA